MRMEYEWNDASPNAAYDEAFEEIEAAGAAIGKGYEAALSFEEIFTNVMKHAYAAPPAWLKVTIDAGAASLVIVFEDRGVPFDPTEHEPAKAKKGAVGGQGIGIVEKLASSVGYTRTPSGENVFAIGFGEGSVLSFLPL